MSTTEGRTTSIPGGRVSPSKLTTAFGRAGCALKFYYRYVEGIRSPTSASLLAGTAFDKATTLLHEQRRVHEAVDLDAAKQEFVQAWANPPEEDADGNAIDYDLSDALDDIEPRAHNALDLYAASTQGQRVQETQLHVEAAFDETDAILHGYVDLVELCNDGKLVVTDVKTSIGSRKKWSEADAGDDMQLGIYSMLVEQHYGQYVAAQGWRHARLGGKVEVGSTHVTAPNHLSTLTRVGFWLNTLEQWCSSGSFAPTGKDADSWVCSEKYCAYFHRCEFGARAKTSVSFTI